MVSALTSDRHYCSTHQESYAATFGACPHCLAALQIRELREMVHVLQSRITDQDTQAMQDRRRIVALEHRLNNAQEAHNAHARAELATGWQE